MYRTALFLTACLALPLSAQDVPETPPAAASDTGEATQGKPKVTESIVVTATRSERGVDTLPVSTTVIDEKKLETAPSSTVHDVLRTVPGVHLPLLGGPGLQPQSARVSMHGLGGTRALVLLDGVPIHDAYYGTVQWQKVPLDTLRQIEVVRGGSAGLFGNYALGGTINLLTRPVDRGRIVADGAWGNRNTHRGSLRIDYPVNASLGIRVSHDRYDTDGFLVFVDPGPLDFPAWNDSAVTSARLDYRPSDATRAFLRSNWSEIDISMGVPIDGSERSILDVAAGVQRAVSRSGLITATVFHQKQELVDFDAGAAPGGQSLYHAATDTVPSTASGASLEWTLPGPGNIRSLTFGADVYRVDVDDTLKRFDQAGAETGTTFIEGKQRFAGAFAQASWQPNDRLEVLTTVRLDDYRNQDGSERQSTGSQTSYPESTATELDPRVSIRYSLNPRFLLRGSAYRAFKAPVLRELYRTERARIGTVLANPNLEAETLLGAEAGLEWTSGRMRAAVNIYRSEVDGLSARVAVGPPGTVQNQNLGTIRSQGIEVMASTALSSHWSLEAAYTWADSVVIEDPNPNFEGNLVPDVAPHIGSLSLRYRSRHGTTLDVSGRAVSESYGEAANRFPQPAHEVIDVSVSHPLRPWLVVYVLGENIFDEEYWYALSSGTPRATQPRSILGGFRFRFDSL